MVRASGHARVLAPITRLLVMACCQWKSTAAGLRRYFPSESAYQRSLYRANMIDYGLDNLPGGPLMVEGLPTFRTALRWALPKRRAAMIPLEHDRRQPEAVPLALPCRDYANWPTLRYMLRGNTVSDAR